MAHASGIRSTSDTRSSRVITSNFAAGWIGSIVGMIAEDWLPRTRSGYHRPAAEAAVSVAKSTSPLRGLFELGGQLFLQGMRATAFAIAGGAHSSGEMVSLLASLRSLLLFSTDQRIGFTPAPMLCEIREPVGRSLLGFSCRALVWSMLLLWRSHLLS